jgi:2,5-diamino-6-(ribosylamino)-4(3H)-pyrimidinone 5'-phosphate reductase
LFPKIILHNSISLDGSFVNFEVNMGVHYHITGSYKPEAHLIGSNTMKTGIELYGEEVPPEEKGDFEKPKRDEGLPYWVILDTKGICKGLLHTCRRFEYCRDIIVLISEETPEDYIHFLKERDYNYHRVGQTHVDLKKSLELLAEKYDFKTVLADTGRILGNLLLEQGLVSEISLLIHPIVVGNEGENLFSRITNNIKLKLLKNETLENGHIWVCYKVEN